MKKTLTILFAFFVTCVVAQVPQGVGYQGVATDANGIELVNQPISIRASVLSGSANGTVEWEETHATSTDTFGLFTLTIGQGTNTTNGAQTSFADISWGTNTHFLKIEMDVTGGSNYSFMGTNQMMSVPYALYAENAGIDYDSISTMISNDSAFIISVGGGMGGGCDFRFPDGLDGDPITIEISSSQPYTVLPGQRLYVLQKNNAFTLYKNAGVEVSNSNELLLPIIFNENDVISTPISQATYISGILITSPNSNVQPITIQVNGNGLSYTVPSGQRLYILNRNAWTNIYKNGNEITPSTQETVLPVIFNENDILTTSHWGGGYDNISGYLADENYFAGCGGGGGSSSTSINYDSLANIISMDSTFITNVGGGIGGGGCDFNFPEGLHGTEVTFEIGTNNYTVPQNKTLYILNHYSVDWDRRLAIDGMSINDGSNTASYPNLGNPIIVGAGRVLSNNQNSNSSTINGYLVNENYFAGCGGGGGSSSTSIYYDSLANIISMDSTFITTVGGGIGGGGCDFRFPEGINGEGVSTDVTQSNPYSVPTGKRLYLLSWTASAPVINGLFDYINLHTGVPLILNSGQSVSPEDPNVTSRMNGFLVPENNNVQVISIDVTQSNPYSVPIGKRLYLLNWTGSPAVINGLSDFINLHSGQPLILNSGQSVSPEDPNLTSRMNGYLADENYFAGCGGGSSSGSSASNATIDSLSQVVSNLDSSLTALTSLLTFGCTDATASNYNPNANVDDGSCTYLAIGDFFQGGIIFWLNGSGGGLVCAVGDLPNSEWGCYGTTISGADGIAIGTGAQNTIDIEAGCGTANIAADRCANLSLNGYNDWFLPSKDELNQMYQNKAAINATATLNGGSDFASSSYWSSSEYNLNIAWEQSFGTGNQYGTYKTYTLYVRAVRAF